MHSIIAIVTVMVTLQGPSLTPERIQIIDTGFVPFQMTSVDAGPSTGDMLNYHFFPGMNDYAGGYYSNAAGQFSYVVERPFYLAENPRRPELMSTAHYLRGMIYAYHASGVGRYELALEDFASAIEWNPRNWSAYLELSRVYSTLKFVDEAASVLQRLLESGPDEEMIEQGRTELERITQKQSLEDSVPE